ncbi:glycoside hydrolase family 43 protein [Sinomicrobium soli]|uniref:glycoside hydrolase family 43 protein n=1 Tax=Sinomicrobium sp. N-1-3-6 TaxID=2219864 RepID=UPI000DCCCDD9|nr:glycoside hydrolase 43 family protein [Sinomicrobium sp. N-1-3-6]RAV30395.1 glycoside hydrolase [Sinomicrobium sp. N-1-3-6]
MHKITITIALFSVFLFRSALFAQEFVSAAWVSDQGDGTYKNPILHADYSDPDICRVGDDFYMTASSFNAIPGLPILHSKDLVNWKLIGYALDRQPPFEHFSKPQHGNGVWAPAIRHHNGEFYIYYGDPDFGIYMIKSEDPAGPWEEPVLVEEGKGLIDACPLWDDDGKAYLVHAYAGSRAGIKSVVVVKPMNAEGTKVTGAGKLVFDGHDAHPTVEGTKFYKRNGYYYIFAPAGGVSTGWQLAMRAKHPYGPYEERIVMDQGKTDINGPHQGGWVELDNGENWFVHFQDKEAYGRIVHLQPMEWKNDWPVIGEDRDGDGKGQPVLRHKKPDVGRLYPIETPQDSDEFDGNDISLQWQWHANPRATWAFANPADGKLRLFTDKLPDDSKNLWDAPNLFLQKFPAEEFKVTTALEFHPNPKLDNEKAGLIVMGMSYAYISLESKDGEIHISQVICEDAEHGKPERIAETVELKGNKVQFRVEVTKGGKCTFGYSTNGRKFKSLGKTFTAVPGKWIGTKVGLFAIRDTKINDSGFADIDWFRIEQ